MNELVKGLKIGEIYHFKTPSGVLGDVALDKIDEYIKVASKTFKEFELPSPKVLAETHDDWKMWMVTKGKYAGTYPKRYAQNIYKETGNKIPLGITAKLGEILSANCDKGEVYIFDIVDRCEWKPGKFGESTSSCWWNEYTPARIGLFNNGGLAIRFFDEEQAKKREVGLGRAWIYPHPTKSILFIFNAYHRNSVSLLTMARILGTLVGAAYYNIHLDIEGAYINGDEGFGIGAFLEESSYTLEIGISCECARCGDELDTEDINMWNGNAYCYDCFCERTFCCYKCGNRHDVTNLIEVSGESYCEDCASNYSCDCMDCGGLYDTDEINSVNDGSVCDSCFDNYTCCDECKEYFKTDTMVELGENNYCGSCIDDISFICTTCNERFDNVVEQDGLCPSCKEEEEDDEH